MRMETHPTGGSYATAPSEKAAADLDLSVRAVALPLHEREFGSNVIIEFVDPIVLRRISHDHGPGRERRLGNGIAGAGLSMYGSRWACPDKTQLDFNRYRRL